MKQYFLSIQFSYLRSPVMSSMYKPKIYTKGGDNAVHAFLWCRFLKFPVNSINQVVHMPTKG